jgi:hypothetical protein
MTAEYRIFCSAKKRCNNPQDKSYSDYGGRGIMFLFSNFESFFGEIGTRPSPELVLDRIHNDGNYEKGNVKWSTVSESNKNRRELERNVNGTFIRR